MGERSSCMMVRARPIRRRAAEGTAVTPNRIAILAAALIVPCAGAVAGPADPAAEIADRAAQAGVAAPPLLAPVEEARRLGLPAAPVADKVLEGLAKGVPPDRVAAVAASLVSRMAEADAVLAGARAAGLAPVPDRARALADLAQSLQAGMDRPSLEALVAAAREARSGTEAVTAAARAMGQLARRGLAPAEVLPLGRALVGRPGQAAEVAPLFDAWRAEGGRGEHAFLAEAEGRVAAGRPLAGMVDRFGETPDRLVREGARREEEAGRRGGDRELRPGERGEGARGAASGSDDAGRNRDRKP